MWAASLAWTRVARPADRLGAVALEGELVDQLAVDRLDDLPGLVDGAGQRRRQLRLLVLAPGGEHGEVVARGEQLVQRAVDVALVAQHGQPGLVDQQLLGQRRCPPRWPATRAKSRTRPHGADRAGAA